MKIQIVVAAHKFYPMPPEEMYLPLHAGRALTGVETGFAGDDTRDNISSRNRTFCELTCLYWAWKNLDADFIGLCHYRRYFKGGAGGILTGAEAETILSRTPVVVPKKRRYVLETNFQHYVHAHHRRDLAETRRILAEKYPDDLGAFDRVMRRRSGRRFNMLIMRRDLFDGYCAWLFDVLFELEKRLDISSYDDYSRRVFGFVGERLLDVYLEAHPVPFTELAVLHLESEHWMKKIAGFLLRKISGGRLGRR
ncbi:MAG: DUF4422 domain-containing protein [Victivallaceae bacterium]|nr:DUF4422 domain-containing protein [Victivallaceae bacterium]